MIKYKFSAIVDSDNILRTVVKYSEEGALNIDNIFTAIDITEDLHNDLLAKNYIPMKLDSSTGLFIPIIDEDWTQIQYEDMEIGSASLTTNELGVTSLVVDGKYWMDNARLAVDELANQYNKASGNVLIGGLGMGIVALLVATKSSVKSITVVENNKDVIDLFLAQDFYMSKINIIHGDIYKHKGKYDTILLDYYNTEDMSVDFITTEYTKLSKNIRGSAWEWYYGEKVPTTGLFNIEVATAEINRFKKKSNVIAKLDKLSEAAIKALKKISTLPIDDDTVFDNDYFIYNIDTKKYQAVGISWTNGDRVFAAKYQLGRITDFYEVYNTEEVFSAELDMVTHEKICIYPKRGDNKVGLDGTLIQENQFIDTPADLPADFVTDLEKQDFRFINDIFYASYKPYGRIVECEYPY